MAARRVVIALLIVWATVPAAAQRSATVTISVVATTDLHGGVLPRGERGGIALLGGYLRNLRAARLRDGGGVLLVDSGDMFQGTLESNLNEGAAVVRAYNALGYVATTIGITNSISVRRVLTRPRVSRARTRAAR
jgi:5'-nucleotidase